MLLKEKIIQLRENGLSYRQIAETIPCSKSSISYYLTPGSKQKSIARTYRRREKSHPFNRKLEHFRDIYPKSFAVKQNNNKTRYLIYQKIHTFSKKHGDKNTRMQHNFTVDDVINKFGENPVCYLTGEPIDINKPRTYQFDHILPRSRGGDNSLSNLGLCTKKANLLKNDQTPEELFLTCKQILEHNGYKVIK